MEMTITEALNELKVLANRISKEINGSVFIISHKTGNAPVGFSTVKAFEEKAESVYKSVTDLIERRNKIKAAIVRSNALTGVEVNGTAYTVAEAIERKTSIEFQRNLLQLMHRQYGSTMQLAEKQNHLLQGKLDNLIETTIGKEKSDPNAMAQITENFWKLNKVEVSDPLHLMEKIESYQNDIESFLNKIDVALTISNSTVNIEV